MNPIIQAMMARVGTRALGAAGSLAGTGTGIGAAISRGTGMGGDMLTHAPDGRTWPQVMQDRTPNGRVAGAFDQLPVGPQQQGAQAPAPIDRIKAAFDAVHSQPPMQQAPGAPMNLASHGVVNVPDAQRPAPPQEPQSQPMGFFMRNAMMQRDPEGGGYLNPAMAAQASQGSFPFANAFVDPNSDRKAPSLPDWLRDPTGYHDKTKFLGGWPAVVGDVNEQAGNRSMLDFLRPNQR